MWGGAFNTKFRRVLIIGMGLIGGSIGMALKCSGMAGTIRGVDLKQDIIDEAGRRGAIDGGTTDLLSEVAEANMVILAVPVKKCAALVQEMIPYFKDGCLITDVASTKQEIVYDLERILPPKVYFIGGHPMTGSEKFGIAAADARLLKNVIYVLTPTEKTKPEVLEIMCGFIESLGSCVFCLPPEEHDRLVGLVSHLPHIVAVALVSALQESLENREKLITLTAGGFCDTTRIAMGNPVIWRDICLTNKKAILNAIKYFKHELDRLEDLIEHKNSEGLSKYFIEARDFRRQVSYHENKPS